MLFFLFLMQRYYFFPLITNILEHVVLKAKFL